MKRMLSGLLALLLTFCLSAGVLAESTEKAAAAALPLPVYTETECEWDQDGNLIAETAYDLDGAPAVNSRGFHKAEYAYTEQGNLLTETYTGLDGEPVNAEGGYAVAVFTYGKNASGKTSVMELLSLSNEILGTLRVEKKTYSVDGMILTLFFYFEGYIYKYNLMLEESNQGGKNLILFENQSIEKKKYYNRKKYYFPGR